MIDLPTKFPGDDGGKKKRVVKSVELFAVYYFDLLAKTFRGELVPQDLNNKPASVLLERI